MFNKLYIGEVKKLLKPKTIIALSIILIVFLGIYAITFDVMMDVSQPAEMPEAEAPYEEEGEIISSPYQALYGKNVYTEETIAQYLAVAEWNLEQAKMIREENSFYYRTNNDPVYQEKALVTVFKYIQDNELYGEEIEIYRTGSTFDGMSSQGFMQGFFTLLISIVLIYGVVIGAGSYAGEMQSGSLKMMFMRPITRNKLTTAKILALFTMIGILMAAGIIISLIYGLIKYSPASDESVLVVFNAMSVFKGTYGLMLFLNICFGLVKAFAIVLFAFALATVTKNRIIAIIFGVLLNIGIVAQLLSLLKIGRFLFTTSSDFSIYFGVTSYIPAGGNFFIALPVLIVYLAVFLVSTYMIFNKRDIA